MQTLFVFGIGRNFGDGNDGDAAISKTPSNLSSPTPKKSARHGAAVDFFQ
jgi:hypothetical protein